MDMHYQTQSTNTNSSNFNSSEDLNNVLETKKLITKNVDISSLSLSNRYHQLFLSEKYSDCSFCIDNRLIKAHKLILSTASPVFEAMLYGPLNINDNIDAIGTKIIEITDISFDIFHKLLNFIYTNNLNFNNENLQNTIELYYCGEKYLLQELKQKSLNAIKQKLRFDNILETLDLAIYTNLELLIKICIQFFEQYCISSENGAQKFMSAIKSSYHHVSKECMMQIINLTIDKNNCNKKYLYWFIREWIKNDYDSNKKTDQNSSTYMKQNAISNNNNMEIQLSEDIIKNINKNFNGFIDNQNYWNNIIFATGNNFYGLEKVTFVERTYFKARQPFAISDSNYKFEILIKSNQYITLIGLIIHSRLQPNPIVSVDSNNRYQNFYINLSNQNTNEYMESVRIEIVSKTTDENGDRQEIIEYNQNLEEKYFAYNCDINIALNSKIILIPDEDYIIKLIWNKRGNGAEYPCSLMANKVSGLEFNDLTTQNNGSILKGLKFLKNDKNNYSLN